METPVKLNTPVVDAVNADQGHRYHDRRGEIWTEREGAKLLSD